MPDLFVVLADATRREILRALLDAQAEGSGELSVGELVGRLSLTQPTVSKHLKTLRELSVVAVREQGQHRFYRLEAAKLEPVAHWLGPFLTKEQADEVNAPVLAAAPAHPLPPNVRAIAVRIGSTAASVAGLLPGRVRAGAA
jgi:ArsR family transcriptional regulator, arsenate/arsenite/antimonite-responsive transcriptional repressor